MSPDTRFGAYEVQALIGRGGMSEVYRARDVRLNREVAVKVLGRPFASDPAWLTRFDREAQLLAKLFDPRQPSPITRLTEQHVDNGGSLSPDERWLAYQSAAIGLGGLRAFAGDVRTCNRVVAGSRGIPGLSPRWTDARAGAR